VFTKKHENNLSRMPRAVGGKAGPATGGKMVGAAHTALGKFTPDYTNSPLPCHTERKKNAKKRNVASSLSTCPGSLRFASPHHGPFLCMSLRQRKEVGSKKIAFLPPVALISAKDCLFERLGSQWPKKMQGAHTLGPVQRVWRGKKEEDAKGEHSRDVGNSSCVEKRKVPTKNAYSSGKKLAH